MMTNHQSSGPGRQLRLERLHLGGTGIFLVPLDHSITYGPVATNEGFDRIVEDLAANGADGIILHKGRMRFVDAALFRDLALVVHMSASTDIGPDPDRKTVVTAVEDALRLGADAVSAHVNLGSDSESDQLADLGRIGDACARWGLPLIAMVYPRGPRVREGGELVHHAAAVAADLGADLVKTVYTGDVASMTDAVRSSPIPILAAGGAPVGDEDELYRLVADVMAAGCGGVAIGRNIFQANDVARVTHRVAGLVHGEGRLDPRFDQLAVTAS